MDRLINYFLNGSWKTTFCGLLALVGGGISQFFPEHARFGNFLVFLGTGLGLLMARDNNKSSEQVASAPASSLVPGTKLLLAIGVAALLVVTSGLAVTGCGTPPERKAFSGAVATRVGVELALAEFKELARAGKVKPEEIALARKALETYKLADDAYLKALEVAVTTKDVSGLGKAVDVWRATYGNLWSILVLYEPRLDPNPPQGTTATF